jgi:acyl carrier protein phosphodiesterase
MNYLAHLFLADPSPEALIGNLLGDFRTGIPLTYYAPSIRQGIETHLKIDAYTDQHPIVRTSKQRFSLSQRRFTGIILDLVYDHYLAMHWHLYSQVSLSEFAQGVYQVLSSHQAMLPEKLQQVLPSMVQHNWLCAYANLAELEFVLERIAKRFKRPTPIAASYGEIVANYAALETDFFTFFPDLIAYAAALQGVSNSLPPLASRANP